MAVPFLEVVVIHKTLKKSMVLLGVVFVFAFCFVLFFDLEHFEV